MTKRLTNANLTEIKKRVDKVAKGNLLVSLSALQTNNKVIFEDVPALLAEVERLRNENSLLCPIGDLDVITSLRTEKSMYMEHIAELEAEVERLRALSHKLNEELRDLGEAGVWEFSGNIESDIAKNEKAYAETKRKIDGVDSDD